MNENPDHAGCLADNVMHFARALRSAGLPVGPRSVVDALEAVRIAGVGRRDDFYWVLHAIFVHRRDQRELFDQMFHLFWRDPKLLERMLGLALPNLEAAFDDARDPVQRRAADALNLGDNEPSDDQDEIEFDMTMTFSEQDALRQMDFDDMSVEEIEAAKRSIARMHLAFDTVPSRRLRASYGGDRIDMRRSLRAMTRSPQGIIPLERVEQQDRPPSLVLLCDVSGSMTGYSRMLIHFAHALTNDRHRVHTFAFGTRLTNITRDLKNRDVDRALNLVSKRVDDWSGGTRIGECLGEFNRLWSRRVLGHGAVVVLVTDGLDRDADGALGRHMALLQRSCRRLIWLNPLLRWRGFEPRSWGIRTMLPHVDAFRTCHNLDSLEDLADALSGSDHDANREMRRWLEAA
ncbi:MAG: VWA domain-containing protein [Rhodospirillaceae bacterium]|nr:VWA domain-containing protein [Rhodospirillaceae bacterium]|tara:strand:+ start:6634 stop:7845 length:1212 start_codon:yes stop_codon:yes gene_type:complete